MKANVQETTGSQTRRLLRNHRTLRAALCSRPLTLACVHYNALQCSFRGVHHASAMCLLPRLMNEDPFVRFSTTVFHFDFKGAI
jgi:hypothetical protein